MLLKSIVVAEDHGRYEEIINRYRGDDAELLIAALGLMVYRMLSDLASATGRSAGEILEEIDRLLAEEGLWAQGIVPVDLEALRSGSGEQDVSPPSSAT